MIFGRKRRRDETTELHDRHHNDSADSYGDPYGDADSDWDDEDALHLGDARFESDHRRTRLTSTLGCLLPLGLLALIAGGGYYGYQRVQDAVGSNSCKVRDDRFDYQWSPEQVANSATISMVGTDVLRLPTRASQIANATAIQESKLRNLRSGDRDSLGLFQQRPSMGWGTAEQILDPVYASRRFYAALVKVDQWQTRPLTEVAQDVQRSGYPEAYADHETQGRVLATSFEGKFPESLGCRLDDPTEPGSPADVVAKLREQTGVTATPSGKYVTVRAQSTKQAWGIGHWAVAHAQSEQISSVVVGGRAWNRTSDRSGWTWDKASNPTASETTVRIELH